MKRRELTPILLVLVLVTLLAACAAPAATPAPPTAVPAAATAAPTVAAAPTAPPTEVPAASAAATTAPAAPTAAATAAAPVTLQVWIYTSFAPDQNAPIYAAVQKFEQANPGITIELVPTPSTSSAFRDKFITAAQAGSGPDVIMSDIAWSPSLAAMGIMLPLDQYVGDNAANFFPGPMQTVTYQGKLYGLPWYTNAVGMIYNKTAFQQANLPLPKDGWTWDDFTKDAQALTGNGKYGFGAMLGYGGTYEWYPWLWEAGGQLLTADGTKVAFNSPEGLQATKAFLGLYTTQKVIPEAAKTWQSWDELEAAFASGLIAMYEAGDWVLAPTDAKKPAFEWGVAPLPMEKTTSSEVGGANWMINKNTKNPDAAYKWVEFITGPDVFGLMDSYKRQAARKGGTQQIDTADPRMQVFLGILDYAQALPSQPNWTNVDYNCLEPDFQKVLLQGASVESVMADAETCGNNALAGK